MIMNNPDNGAYEIYNVGGNTTRQPTSTLHVRASIRPRPEAPPIALAGQEHGRTIQLTDVVARPSTGI